MAKLRVVKKKTKNPRESEFGSMDDLTNFRMRYETKKKLANSRQAAILCQLQQINERHNYVDW